jgi:hypothetical protein
MKFTTAYLAITCVTTCTSVHAFITPSTTTTTATTLSSECSSRRKVGDVQVLLNMNQSSNNDNDSKNGNNGTMSRNNFFKSIGGGFSLIGLSSISSNVQPALAAADSKPDSLDIDNFLRTGQEAFPMGVSSQAGKSKPVTGVYLRDGTIPSRDSRTGDVLSEIVLGNKADLSAVLVSFKSPWPLAKGTVFDVECRDAKTGDGAFLSVTEHTNTNDITQIPQSFFIEQLFAPTGRFSFYGSPTNLKIKKSEIVDGNKRVITFTFANLSQSTNAEIPRTAMMVASIPEGMDQAVMLVGSSLTSRWNSKGMDSAIRGTIDSFNASPSPKTSMRVRAKMPDYSLE